MMNSLELLSKELEYCLISTRIFNGEVIEIRQRVDLIKNNLKIEIYSKEHAPVHFHVKSKDINASFKIDNCEFIEGNISNDNIKKVQYWYSQRNNKQRLIDVWNATRPSDCPVGIYKNQ